MVPNSLRTAFFGLIALALLPGACTKMPLVAPSGTVITLISTTNVLPVNGSADIVAILVENGQTTAPTTTTPGGGTTPSASTSTSTGTAVHNGTVVSFTTTLGRIEPAEAKTTGGQVTVKLIADGRSGVATITAYSGGASKTLTVNVGAAAAARILVTATPQTLPASGGNATVTATVQDQQGNPISGVPVAFSTTAGTLGVTTAVTDPFGNATTTLTTTAEATVTASSGGGGTSTLSGTVVIKILPRGTVTLTGPTGTVTVGAPTTFTVGVGSTVAVSDVTIDFGDRTTRSLGAISQSTTVAHTYNRTGTYTASATAKFVDGTSSTVSTDVVVLDWDFTISSCPGADVLTAPTQTYGVTLNPSTLSMSDYLWTFTGVEQDPESGTISGGSSITHTWTSRGTKTVSVTATPTNAPSKTRVCTLTVK